MAAATARQRLDELGLELPVQQAPRHAYVPTRADGDVLYLSGKTAMLDGVVQFSGALRTTDDLEHGRAAARLCALQLLAAIDDAAGLDRVSAMLRLTVYVASAPGFGAQPEVANAASQLLVDVLGEPGRHTRSAIGVADLPGGSSVEVDAIIRLHPEARP